MEERSTFRRQTIETASSLSVSGGARFHPLGWDAPGAVGQSGPRDVWIRGRVSTRKLGDLCASALSLQDYPMPPRTIQESYRLRVSDRTMVANFATRSGLLVSRKLEWRRRQQWAAMKPTGNDENSSGRFSPGQTQSGSRQSAQLNGKRGWMAPRTSAVSGGRRRILLTSLFIGLPSNGQRALSVVTVNKRLTRLLTGE